MPGRIGIPFFHRQRHGVNGFIQVLLEFVVALLKFLLRQFAFDDFQFQLLVQLRQFRCPFLHHGFELIAMLFKLIFDLHLF